ncbi:copper transporter, partial [Nocardia sp. NPDC005978]|uniref:copper transporter n=1 Tax=Nocardia sp. NPDC005978 TaxID=3156725 RepID=UPI0033A01633
MLSFRHHAVSIAAIFLALAVGVVLGSQTRSDGFISGQGDRPGSDALIAENDRLTAQLRAADDFLSGSSGKLLAGNLAGRSVLVFAAPDADSADVDSVTAARLGPG